MRFFNWRFSWSKKWLLLILIPSLFLNGYFLYRASQSKKKVGSRAEVKVVRVIDGDTLILSGNQRLRLRQLDAPELEYCGGQEARELLVKLVKGQPVVIKEETVDYQGRPMGLVYQDGRLINLVMLESGWVRYHSDQTSVRKELKEAGNQAKKARLGVFSPRCYRKEPVDPDCLIKANIDKSTGTRLYYLPNCAQYQFTIVEEDLGEAWFCTEKEAQEAGFAKAATCH